MDVMMSMNVSDIAILNIHGIDYRCIISGITLLVTCMMIIKLSHYRHCLQKRERM